MAELFSCTPNLFIIGAAKSGTTSLVDILARHHQVFVPFAKEPHFFAIDDVYFQQGLAWYKDNYYAQAGGYPIRLDASTSYLYWSHKVAPRISRTYDDPSLLKFIVIFRNPVDRAYSMYWHMYRDGREDLPFELALQREEERLQECWDKISKTASQQYGYFRGGCYATLLRPFLDLFPKENFLFLFYDDLFTGSADKEMERLAHFLELDSSLVANVSKKNLAALPRNVAIQRFLLSPSGPLHTLLRFFTRFLPYEKRFKLKRALLTANLRPFSYPALQMETRKSLIVRYEAEIKDLEKITGRDLSRWYSSG